MKAYKCDCMLITYINLFFPALTASSLPMRVGVFGTRD